MAFSIQSKPISYAPSRIILSGAIAFVAMTFLTGCHSLIKKTVSPLDQASIARERFNGSSACDTIDACAGYTETNWTPLPSCTSWDSSFDEAPIPYDLHEHVSARDEPNRNTFASPNSRVKRHVASSVVEQASYSVDDNVVQRNTGINDEVYEYAESCLACEESAAPCNDKEASSNEKQLDQVSIEYLQ